MAHVSNIVTDVPPTKTAEVRGWSKLYTVAPFILGNELGERLAYYGLSTNLVNYFKDLGASSATACMLTPLFGGFCYIFPLLGGWVADARLGRFKTILIFSLVYLLGMFCLTMSVLIPGIRVPKNTDANAGQWALLAFSLGLVSLGTGGIKPNVSTFGADQFDESIERERKDKSSFFNYFYLFINIGAIVASVVIVDIQDRNMWDVGFAIPTVVLFLAVILFVAGKPRYFLHPMGASNLTLFVQVTRTALRNRSIRRRRYKSSPVEDNSDVRMLSGGPSSAEYHWLDNAVSEDGFTQDKVDDVKLVYSIFPILITTIFYWQASRILQSLLIAVDARMVYNQMFTMFVLQGNQMNRNASFRDKPIASATISAFDTASIIVLIPIYDLIIVPGAKKFLKFEISILQRIGAGYVLGALSMISAYLIERERLRRFHRDGAYTIIEDGDEVHVVDLSIWWMVIPYSLVGASEVLASIGTMELFYNQAPNSMRSLMSALNLLSTGVANYICMLLVAIVNPLSGAFGRKWITDDANEGHFDYFYLLIAAIMMTVFIAFYFIARRFRHKPFSAISIRPVNQVGRSVWMSL